jgi:hypothetical protein
MDHGGADGRQRGEEEAAARCVGRRLQKPARTALRLGRGFAARPDRLPGAMPVASVKEREPGCRHRRTGSAACIAMLRRTEAGRHWRRNPPVTAEQRRLGRRGRRTDAHPAVLCVGAEASWRCGAGSSGDAAPACSRRVAGRAPVTRLRPQASVRRGRSVSGTCCLRTGRRVLADADGNGAGDGEVAAHDLACGRAGFR